MTTKRSKPARRNTRNRPPKRSSWALLGLAGAVVLLLAVACEPKPSTTGTVTTPAPSTTQLSQTTTSSTTGNARKTTAAPSPTVPTTIRTTTTATTTTTTPQTTLDPELIALRQKLESKTFYSGIWLDDVELSGKTLAEAKDIFAGLQTDVAKSVAMSLDVGGRSFAFSGKESGFQNDYEAKLEKAWNIGRTGNSTNEADLIRERAAVIEKLKTTPIKLISGFIWSETMIAERVAAIAKEVDTSNADVIRATGFDTSKNTFIFPATTTGLKVDLEKSVQAIVQQLTAGNLKARVALPTSILPGKPLPANLNKTLGKISEATTILRDRTPDRVTNVRKVNTILTGIVINPGETFSFNATVGQRTTARGFMPAGAIKAGRIIDEVGGGICQPNGTLYQAVLKADLRIVERWSHSFPSSYTELGQDATVNWPGADFKWRNNTDYPVAIVGTLINNNTVVKYQLYGRKLPAGTSIKLVTRIVEETPPLTTVEYRRDKETAAGKVVLDRAPKPGYVVDTYKSWQRNGAEFKAELITRSTYKAFGALYLLGPGATAPTVTPTIKVTPAPTPTTAAPTTTATTEPTTTATATVLTTTMAPQTTTKTTAAPTTTKSSKSTTTADPETTTVVTTTKDVVTTAGAPKATTSKPKTSITPKATTTKA